MGRLYTRVTYIRQKLLGIPLRTIIEADPQAVIASRFFADLIHHPVPTSADICDAAFMLSLGFRTVMLGDALCLHRDTVLEALNLLQAIAGEIP